MKKGIVFLALLFAGKFLCAQSPPPEIVDLKYDPNYVESYYDDLIVRVYSADKGNHALITDGSNDLNMLYRSNDHFKLGIGANYKWFGLKIGTDLPIESSNIDRYGKSSSYGLQSYLISRPFIVDITALKTIGYYLTLLGRNAQEIAENGQFNEIRSDVETENLSANVIYVVNHKRFSYKAAFNQTDLQLRNAGSLLLGGRVGYYNIGGELDLIAEELGSDYFEDYAGLYDFRTFSALGSVGYAYSVVPFRRAIITASVSGQIGYQKNTLHFDNRDTEYRSKPGLGASVRLAGGYHFKRFYLGATFVQSHFNSDIHFSDPQISNGNSFLEFTLSKRIDFL